jgi:hypothetical protein
VFFGAAGAPFISSREQSTWLQQAQQDTYGRVRCAISKVPPNCHSPEHLFSLEHANRNLFLFFGNERHFCR